MWSLLVIMFFSYLGGSFPSSIVLGKLLKNIDIRDFGSGNAGGTNTIRVLGLNWGLLVILVDFLKGFYAVSLISGIRIGEFQIDNNSLLQIVAGLSAIFGHIYSVFAQFRGGKGVATSAGVLFCLHPVVFLLIILIFICTLFSTGIVSISSIVATVSFPFLLVLFNSYFDNVDVFLFAFSIFLALFIIYTHRTNIRRIVTGNEKPNNNIAFFKTILTKIKKSSKENT